MSKRTYKFRLHPTRKQQERLQWTLDRTRELYNAALQERRDAYRMAGKSINYYSQANQLPDIKDIREEYRDIHSQVLQDTLRRVDKAMQAFFRRVKSGETPGYPRFQGRDRYDSFTYPQGGYSLTHDSRVCLSKIGSVKVKLHRELQGTVKTCTIKVRRVSGRKRARQNVAGIVGISRVHLAYPCQLAEISKEKGECSMLGGRQRRRELSTL
jgi:putative transposase